MEKNQIVLLEDRGLILISGEDAKNFLQNIITNDIERVSLTSTIFSALFTPQGKYLFEFFSLKAKDGYLLDCDNKFTNEIITYLSKYKLRSKIEIKDVSSKYTIGIISLENFLEIQKNEGISNNTIEYRDSTFFIDPRNKRLGARIVSPLEKLYLTIKKLSLKIVGPNLYYKNAHSLGVPIRGVENLKEKLFGLEANFEELQAIDFKKGCYIGQENTARMKLKNKIRRKLYAIKSDEKLKIGDDLSFGNNKVGTVLINGLYPFALIKLFDPNILEFKDKILLSQNNIETKIIS